MIYTSSKTLEEIVAEVIRQRFKELKGSPLKTAKSLGISKAKMYRKILQYRLREDLEAPATILVIGSSTTDSNW